MNAGREGEEARGRRGPRLACRGLGFLLTVAAGVAGPAGAAASGEPLGEAEVLERGLGREALAGIVRGAVEAAEGEVQGTRRWQNPVLSFTFEQARGGGGGADEGIYLLQQRIEPGGRRRLRRQAAEERVERAEHRGAMLRVEVEARLRGVFYELLAAQARVRVAREWRARMARVAEVVELRFRAGDASGYDTKRMAREQATAAARISSAEAERVAAAQELAGMLGGASLGAATPASLRVTGTLLDEGAPVPLDERLRRIEERPDLRALRAEARAAALEERVERGWRVPAFTVGAGYKDVRDSGVDLDGPVAYAAVPLPILNRRRGPAREAAGRRREAASSAELLAQEARGAVRGAFTRARELFWVAQRFHAEAVEPAEELLGTAEAAYEAGEVGVLSLLDAYRSAYEARTESLALALRARKAGIELDRLTGGLTR